MSEPERDADLERAILYVNAAIANLDEVADAMHKAFFTTSESESGYHYVRGLTALANARAKLAGVMPNEEEEEE